MTGGHYLPKLALSFYNEWIVPCCFERFCQSASCDWIRSYFAATDEASCWSTACFHERPFPPHCSEKKCDWTPLRYFHWGFFAAGRNRSCIWVWIAKRRRGGKGFPCLRWFQKDSAGCWCVCWAIFWDWLWTTITNCRPCSNAPRKNKKKPEKRCETILLKEAQERPGTLACCFCRFHLMLAGLAVWTVEQCSHSVE